MIPNLKQMLNRTNEKKRENIKKELNAIRILEGQERKNIFGLIP